MNQDRQSGSNVKIELCVVRLQEPESWVAVLPSGNYQRLPPYMYPTSTS